MMFALKDEAAVDLVAQHHDVAVTDGARDAVNVVLRQHAASRILRRIYYDQLRPIVDQPSEFADVESEIHFLAQLNRHRFRANVIDHRLVDGKSRIRVDDFISFFRQREDAEEYDWLAAGNYNDFFRRYSYAARLAHVAGDRLAQFRQPGRRSVVSESLVQRVGRRFDEVGRGIEIRLTNFEMNNVASLCFQRSRFHQDLEGSLSPQA